MTPAEYETAERFAGLATRTLEKRPDLREEAQAELIARLAHGGAEKDWVESASARLAAKPARASWPLLIFAVVAFILLGGIAGPWTWNTMDEVRVFLPKYLVSDTGPRTRLGDHLSTEERDFVFACIGPEAEVLTKLERQRQVHPEHPGIYEEYTLRYLQAHRTLPPDFHETWQRIDPGNGMWFFLEAIAKNQEEKAGSGTGDPEFRETIALIGRSASGERFESHLPALRARRATLLGEADDLEGEVQRMLFGISALWMPTHRLQMETINNPISAEAKRLSEEKDEDGFRELITIWERLIGRLGWNTSTLLDQTVILVAMANSGESLKQAATNLGMTAEEERIERKLEMRNEARKAYVSRGNVKNMGTLHRLMLIGIAGPPDFPADPSIFDPGRHAEYAIAERVLGLSAALIVLLLLAGAGIESFRRGRRVNGLADGLKPLFTPADPAWILGFGIVLPVLWFLAVTRLMPFDCRDIGLTHYAPPPVLIQAGAGLLFALAMLVQTCRRRIARRAGFLSLRTRLAWIGWAAAIVAALVIPLAGAVRWVPGDGKTFLQSVAALGGIPLLWLLWQAGAVLFAPRDQSLGGALLSRRLIPPFALLAAILLVCQPVLTATERHWYARDEITRSDPTHGGLTRIEALSVEWIRGLFRETFPEGENPR